MPVVEKLRENRRRASTAVILIWCVLALEVIALILGCFQYDMLRTITNDGDISDRAFEAYNEREQLIVIVYYIDFIVYIISVITFIRWFRRAYYNLHQAADNLSYSEGWAVGCWFVPVVNLYLPYRIMKELYLRTKKLLSVEKPETDILTWWWTLWITGIVVGMFSFFYSVNEDFLNEDFLRSTVTYMIENITEIALAIVTVKVIKNYASVEILLHRDEQFLSSKYDYAGDFYEGLACVKSKGKWGYINKTGKEIIPLKYDAAGSFSEGLASVKRNGKWGYIDRNDKVLIPLKYDETYLFSEGFAFVKSNGKWNYIDHDGNEIIPLKYDDAGSFSEGLASVESNGKWGYIDYTGNVVIPPKYDKAYFFSEGLASVKSKGKWGYIDKTGKETVPFKYDVAVSFYEGFAPVELNGEWGYIDKTGKHVEEILDFRF